MTLDAVLVAVRAADIRLTAEGDRLRYDAPAGAVTPELRAALVEHKPLLIKLLGPSRSLVTLKGGLVLPVEAIEFAIDLERRGIPLATDRDHQFIVPTDTRLTEADRAGIRRWSAHLAAVIEYQAPEVSRWPWPPTCSRCRSSNPAARPWP